ncbi:hypothetical protein CS559_04284 [Dickeya solani]|nr:hypothetical protein CTB90_04279 [Dickeya solani]RJR93361.1 hypothetical protein CS559_04284 [Dickeya solani]
MPSALITTDPLPAVAAVTVSGLPSTSLSFARTSTVTGVSSAVVALSLPVTGASFTAVTVMVSVPVATPPAPSLTV